MYVQSSQVTFPGWFPPRGLSGLGDAASTVQTVSGIGTPVLKGALAANAAATAAATGSAATILGMAPALAVPIIGAAIVGVTIAITLLLRSGCGQTCIITSQWANQAEDLLKQNLAAYLALPVPRPKSAQNTAISNFHVVWAKLQELCGQAGTGDAGVRCITDRQEGACKWRDANGQCFNWWSGYLDPIKNDPHVVDDSLAAQTSSAWSALTGGGEATDSPLPLLFGAGLIVAAVMLL